MKNATVWFVIVVLCAIGGGVYYWKRHTEREAHLEQLHSAETARAPTRAQEQEEAQITHPLPAEPAPANQAETKPLPPLAQSDEPLREALRMPVAGEAFDDLVIGKDIVRRIVATIDNLPRKRVAERLGPVKPPGGGVTVSGAGEIVVLSPANYARYARYVELVQAIDAERLVAVYVHYYPLFQDAYRELGYPNKQFNDRVIQTIDDLLSAPLLTEPPELVRPKVLYEFEDPALEDLSAGRKIMLRIGPANADIVKAKLREIRAALIVEKR
jgi:hypothetical protein